MNVPVSRLNRKAFRVQSEISSDQVTSYFSQDIEPCTALTPLTYDVCLVNKGKCIALSADLHVTLSITCARCCELFERAFHLHVDLELVDAQSVGSTDEIVLDQNDLDTVTYQGGVIELDDLLLESVYLELDEQRVCRDDCKGLCAMCGQNLNLISCSCANP